MALARIISRSHACSQELALDLLARGYAVEIVSPDSIPNDIADLELRVDTVLGNQLVASVEAHNGERSASLEFLHHLKAPMVDFIRRPPEPRESARSPEEPVSLNAGPNIEDVELPAEAPQPLPKAVSPAADVLLAPELDREEDARMILPPDPLPSVEVEPPSSFAVEASTIARPTLVQPTTAEPVTVQPGPEPQLPDRPAGWRWRAALTFASVVLLAMVLGFGVRRTGRASGQSSGAAPAENVAASSTDVDFSSSATPERDPKKDPGQVSAVPVSPPAAPAIRSEENSDPAPKESRVATADAAAAGTSTSGTEAKVSRRQGDDLIAPDTVTYLDERFDQRALNKRASKAKLANRSAGKHPSSRKHDGGVIAANTVTYLGKKPAAKAANQDFVSTHHSGKN
ncbi:MAG TPA: hypothetical protein VJX30_18230 [Terriglobales bacterium]|jgi:hypothetical protein|nr:hypothetical protein [Terriglobales bacterium]